MQGSAYGQTIHDWHKLFEQKGAPTATLSFWVQGLYKDPSVWQRHISPELLESLRVIFDFSLPEICKSQTASDGTTKFQMRLRDGLEVETVLIPFHKRFTVCLSTQVGCGMNCGFCYTGTQGLKRNLTAAEIVGQYLVAQNWARTHTSSKLRPSIVLMGQGEPLHNLDEVQKALVILTHPQMADVGHRQITLSTVGYLPGISSLTHFPRINLALSLHSPFDEERSELIPVNQRWPIQEVLQALDEVPRLKRQFITFEYLLIKDFNMTERHADELEKLLGKRAALLNLIPFNPFPGAKWQRPSVDEIEEFKATLVKRRLRVMVRSTKGDDILAACGQLKIKEMARNYAR